MAEQSSDMILVADAAAPAAGSVAAAAPAAAGNAATQAATTAATGGNQAAAAATQSATTEAATSGTFPPFDAATFGAQILWLIICFGVLYVVVARAVQPRLRGIIAARRDKIEGDLAEADRLRQATDRAIADYEAALAAARAKAHGIAEETRTANRAELESKRSGVEADLAHKLGIAETSIGRAKTEALGKVDEIAADTAAALVERLTGAVSADEARAAVASVVGS
jgi:F-type H+-transporting ATPase subunit b